MQKKETILKYLNRSQQMEDPYESFILLWIAFSTFLLSYYARFTDSPYQALESFSKESRFMKAFQEVGKDIVFDSFEEFLRFHYDNKYLWILDLKYAQVFHDFMLGRGNFEHLEADFNKRHFTLKFHKIGVLLDEKGMNFHNYLMLIYQIRCNIFHKGTISSPLNKKTKDKEEKLLWLACMSFRKFCETIMRDEKIL